MGKTRKRWSAAQKPQAEPMMDETGDPNYVSVATAARLKKCSTEAVYGAMRAKLLEFRHLQPFKGALRTVIAIHRDALDSWRPRAYAGRRA